MDFYATSDAVLRLSLLTHVYRAAPRELQSSTTFSHDCVEVARATIAKHHECMAIIQRNDNLLFHTYIHWLVLATIIKRLQSLTFSGHFSPLLSYQL